MPNELVNTITPQRFHLDSPNFNDSFGVIWDGIANGHIGQYKIFMLVKDMITASGAR